MSRSIYALSRAEWAQRFLADAWSGLLRRFTPEMTDEEARDVGEAMTLIHEAQVEVLKEDESRRAAGRDAV